MTDAERHAPRIPAPRVRRAMLALAMPLVGLLYIAQGIYYARVLVPSGDMTVYLVAGSLAVRGELNLFDDRLPGHRAPLPEGVDTEAAHAFDHVGEIGLVAALETVGHVGPHDGPGHVGDRPRGEGLVLELAQVLAGGPSLLAARWLNVALGLLTLLLTAALARRLAGDAAALLAGLFLATQGVVVAYYSYEGYVALAALSFIATLFVLLGGDSPHRRLLGTALNGLFFFVRSNLWPAVPFLLAYALWRARSRAERALLAALVVLPPLFFFAWDPRHLKLLAYVPVLRRLVAPLGYVSVLALEGRETMPLVAQLWEMARLVRRYEFWVLATVVLLLIVVWRLAMGRSVPWVLGNQKFVMLWGLLIYMVTTQVLIYSWNGYWNWKWMGLYFLPFSPLVPLLLGVGFGELLREASVRSRSRKLLSGLLVLLLLPPIFVVRNPGLPAGETLTRDPFSAANRAAAHLRRVVPQEAKVFFFGWIVGYYLSGLPPTYLQQAYGNWHLTGVSHLGGVPVDDFTLRKSGFVPLSDLAQWLSVIDSAYLDAHRDQFPVAIRTMETLLDRHFERVETVSDYTPAATYDVYRRKSRAGG